MSTLPVILSIAGSDCSAGAGLQADLKAGMANGSYPLTVLTCAVSEVPGLVESIIEMPAEFVASQLQLCLAHYPVRAIKAGMLYSSAIVQSVAKVLREHNPIPLVIDPVMIATAGESLMQQEAIACYERELIPHCAVLTPNLDETAALVGASIKTAQQLAEAAQQLAQRYNCAILAKGGHLAGEECIDILVHADGSQRSWTHPRIEGVSTHGTGCTLSAAVAAQLSQGKELEEAVECALRYVERVISQSLFWTEPVPMQALAQG